MKRDGRGGTKVPVKITCCEEEEEKMWFEIGAHVVIMETILISEIKRKTRTRIKRRGEERRGDK